MAIFNSYFDITRGYPSFSDPKNLIDPLFQIDDHQYSHHIIYTPHILG